MKRKQSGFITMGLDFLLSLFAVSLVTAEVVHHEEKIPQQLAMEKHLCDVHKVQEACDTYNKLKAPPPATNKIAKANNTE